MIDIRRDKCQSVGKFHHESLDANRVELSRSIEVKKCNERVSLPLTVLSKISLKSGEILNIFGTSFVTAIHR